MNLYEEKILKEMKDLNDSDYLTNEDIDKYVGRILIHYKEKIKELLKR